MKRNFTILFLMLTLAGFSQGKLTYGSGGTVYNAEGQKVRTDLVRALMNENAEALALYNSGRNKKTWGNILFYGGIGLAATNLIIEMNKSDMPKNWDGYGPAPVERANMTAAIIGSAMIIASIPIKIGYPKKIKAALEKYNAGLADNYKLEPKTTLIASTNQIGLRVEF